MQKALTRSFFLFLFLLVQINLVWGQTAAEVTKGYHLVQKGDTYYGLSRTYQVPVDSLKKWNGDNLALGKTVRVSYKPGQVAKAAKPEPVATAKVVTGTKSPAAPTKTTSTKPVAAKPGITAGTKQKPVTNTFKRYDEPEKFAVANKEAQRVLVIPFDPYLYFSDADNDIALQSKIPRQNVRYVFRNRLNAFVDPKGFETINLLGGVVRDSVNEMNKIYRSLVYNYQDITYSKYNPNPTDEKPKSAAATWLEKQKAKVSGAPAGPVKQASVAHDESKYYGVKVKDPSLYTHFNKAYAVDYYLFINQFEIKTDYTSCLDRVSQNFVRYFTVHYTIFNSQGELVSGNKIRIPYESNVNDVNKIARDNLNRMAQRIMQDLPRPQGVEPVSTVSAQGK